MTNQTIASRIVDLVKGIFGQKESETTASEEPKAAASSATETAEDAKTDEKTTEKAPDAEAAAEAEPAADEADTSEAGEPGGPSAPAAQDKDTVAEELKTAEAKTVTASREPLDNAAAAAAAPTESELPVSNYESVNLASMRARLRKLSLDDVRTLRAYEAANADRADFLKMYDNRIAKLEKGE